MVSRFFPARLKPPPLPKELKSPLELEQELEQQPDIKALVGRLYPEALKAPELIDLPEPEFREITMRALQEMPQPDLEKELRQRGASREDIDQLLPLAVPKQSTEDIVRQLFPLEEPEDVLVEAETDWDKFFAQVKAWGRTPETEQLLTTAGYTPSQIDIIFPPIAPQRIRTYGEMIKARAAGEAPALAPPPSEVLAKYPVAGEGIKEPSALPSLTWIDKVNEIRADPEKLLPFVSSGVEIYTIGRLLTTAKALEAGRTVSEDDLRLLQEYVDRAQRDTTWGYKVFDVIANLVPFAGEFAATGGIYAIGEKASIKAATVALKKISTKAGAEILERRLAQLGVKAVGTVAGGTLRSIPIGATRVPASTLEKQLQHTLTGDEEDVWRSAAKAMGENWIEVVSESTGGLLNVLANPIKGKLMKLAVFKAFQRANPAQSAGDIQKVLDRMGYHGVLAEMFEERVGDVGHGILASVGLGDQPFKLPSLNQLSIELVAFSVPGVAASVLESVPGQEIVAGAKRLATEEVGFAKIPIKRILTPEEATASIDALGKRPLVNPKASSIIRDKQLRAQQNWDKAKATIESRIAKPQPLAPKPAPEAVAKEPWQMTREEFLTGQIPQTGLPTLLEQILSETIYDPMIGKRMRKVTLNNWQWKSLNDWLATRATSSGNLRDRMIELTEGGYIIKRPYGNILILRNRNTPQITISINSLQGHWEQVKQALSEGKPVPASVLADYPELAATMPAAAPRMTVAPAEVAKPTPPMVEVVTPEVTKANLSEELVIEARKYKSAEEFVKEGEYGIRRVRLQDLTPEELTLVRKAGYNTYYKDLYTQYAEGIDYIGLDPSVPSTFPMEIFPTKLKEVKSIPSGLKRGKSYNPSLSSPEKFWVEATKPEAKPVAAPEARVAPPAPAVAKEPWQMTQDEFEKDLLQDYNETAKRLKLPLKIDIGESTMHKWIIEQALSEGKPVPPEVLRDYPELAAKATPVKPVEAIIPQVSKQPWQMTREDITRNKSVANKIKSTVEEDSSGLDFGLRLLPDRKKPYKKGDVLGISYKWIEGKRTRESVGGTSVIKLDAYGVYTEQALERLQRGGYGGDNVALVRGRAIRGGEDEGESIFRNAEIVDVFKKSDLPSEQLSRHKTVIEQALSEGKPVPPEVLKDYPELAATMPAAAPRMTVAPAEVAKPTPPTAEAPVTPEVTPVTKAVTPEVTKPAEAVVRSQEIIKPETVTTKPTTTEVNAKLKLFAQLLASPDLATRREATLELRKIERAKRARNYNERVEELLIEGKSAKEAMEQATKETMSGELPRVTADTISNITKDMTDSFYAKVHEVLAGDAYEEMSTREALTNAILTGDIPREPGVKGGSAYKRLMRVFGEQPEVVKLLDQKKPLRDVMEGVFQEAGRDPVPLDQDILDYLRSLKDVPFGQAQLWFTPLEPSQIVKRSKAETEQELTLLKIELAEQATPLIPFTSRYEAPVDDAIEQIPLWPPTVRDSVIRVLKEMAWSPVDIGGFIKAMKSSVDMSYWRQITPLIPNHKARFAQSNIDAWKALFSQKSAEASWQRIVRDSEDKGLYAIYDALQAKDGRDFLRPLDLAKGTAQWKGVEEFGYLTKERAIPRLTSKIPTIKISNRAFSTGTNSMAWGCFKDFYHAQMRIAEKYASGELKLRPGKTFSIMANMDAYATMLSDWTGRASLGKLSQAAPILGNIFYAPRYALGRVIGPRHLFSANRYVRGEAWKDAAMFIGTIGGAILLGRALGFWDVETDRNSADFMKVRVGHLHLDPWGGAQQFVVFFSRVLDLLTAPITGKKAMARSTITGMQYPLDISNLTENFLKSKQAPLVGLFREYITGKTFGGEKAEWGNLQQWVERLGPMSIQDIIEAYQDKPSMTPVSGALSFVGMGVQTYTGDWKDNIPRLGLPKYEENLPYGVKEPNYNTEDLWADHSSQFKDVDPATITKEKGFPPAIKAIVEARAILDNTQDILKVKLTALNADPNKGTTFVQHYKMWQDRQKLVASGDEAKLKEFDADERTKNAKLGNLTQRQYALLVEYHSITDKKEKAKFLEDNSELDANPYQDWLKSHPKENAQLAVWGKADILTPEAYKETQGLLKELDIPNSAIPDMTLPPKESIEIHFKYLDMVAEGKEGSLEAKLMLALDAREAKKEGRQSYIEWKGLKLSDTPIASLELKVKNHELSDTFASYSDKESPNFLDDTVKDAEGKTARDRAQTKLKADNPDWVDDMNRIEAIEHNGEQYQEQWVEHGKIAGEAPGYNAEEKIWLFENRDVHEWALEQKLTTDTGVNWNIPALRIDAKYRKEDAEYKAILDKYPGRPPEEVQEAKQYLADNEDYRKDVRRREAHKLQTKAGEKFPETEIESYVQYYELEGKGFRQERMLIENYTFAQAMHRIKGKDLPDPAKVPAEPYDDIYDEYKIEFDRLEGLGKFGAPDYEPSTYWREAARKEMRYQAGKLTEFGKAEVRRKGYKALIGMEQYIDDWVQYYSYQDKGFERERFLLKNKGFYRDVWLGRLGNKPVKFSALPEKQPLAILEQAGLLQEYLKKFR